MASSPIPEPPSGTEAHAIYKRAVQGDTAAVTELASAHQLGRLGLPQNVAIAYQLFQLAAANGDPRAMVRLGMMYQYGHPVPQNFSEARRLYEIAANMGDVNAQANLGYLYFMGFGVPVDLAKSRELIRLAAEKGSTAVMLKLAYMLDRGMGGTRDCEAAAGWHLRAAREISAQRVKVTLKRNTNCFPNMSAIGKRRPAWRCRFGYAPRDTITDPSTGYLERKLSLRSERLLAP